MGNKKITDLILIDELDDSCNLPTDDGIQTYRTTAPQVYNYIKTTEKKVIANAETIGSVGTTSQKMAGHNLDTKSFITSLGSNAGAIWLLDSLDDDSGNSLGLTNVGTTPFNRADIFNVAQCADFVRASSRCLYAATTQFDTTNEDFTVGGWFYLDTTAAGEFLMSKYNTTNANKSWYINHSSGTGLTFLVYYDSSNHYDYFTIDDAPVTDGAWHHIAMSYNHTDKTVQGYIDGICIGGIYNTNFSARNNSSGAKLTIGGSDGAGTPADFFDGASCNCFYVKWCMSDYEIKKLYSVKRSIGFLFDNNDFKVEAILQPGGSSKLIREVPAGEIEIARDYANQLLYTRGGYFRSTDKLTLIAR